jgi:hypothetical protein
MFAPLYLEPWQAGLRIEFQSKAFRHSICPLMISMYYWQLIFSPIGSFHPVLFSGVSDRTKSQLPIVKGGWIAGANFSELAPGLANARADKSQRCSQVTLTITNDFMKTEIHN